MVIFHSYVSYLALIYLLRMVFHSRVSFFTHPRQKKNGGTYWIDFHIEGTIVGVVQHMGWYFFRGPRYVLVEGGALAKHTPEAHPEA